MKFKPTLRMNDCVDRLIICSDLPQQVRGSVHAKRAWLIPNRRMGPLSGKVTAPLIPGVSHVAVPSRRIFEVL
jgi:hypothetical protein